MTGELNLQTLIGGMEPVLHPDVFAFCTVAAVPEGVSPRMMFREAEGITLILPMAEAGDLAPEFPCRMITLNVHSALEAVGFIALIATRLAGAGMGVNPVAGFYHDHLFVPEDRAEDAMAILAGMIDAVV